MVALNWRLMLNGLQMDQMTNDDVLYCFGNAENYPRDGGGNQNFLQRMVVGLHNELKHGKRSILAGLSDVVGYLKTRGGGEPDFVIPDPNPKNAQWARNF